MKKNLLMLLAFLFTAHLTFSQQESEALEGDHSLNDRFKILRSKSQSYKEYKVIKETVLDSFWKIVRDSVAAKEAALQARNQNIQQLNAQLKETQVALKDKEESMAAIVHASTHISVLGIDFNKGVFITTVAVIIGGLILFVALISGRLKMVRDSMRQREETYNTLNNEFEEYKRKAMEKQMKLSRELQNERNRLSEMGRS
jgi:hypothetical protein